MLSPDALKDALHKLRVLVVGDVMLDEYWFGEVLRISPEAPVPIVRVHHSEERPGGAANVARNVAALGAQVSLLSVVGPDETAARLRRVLDEKGIPHALEVDNSICTTKKLRVIGHQQQMLRIDFEATPSGHSLDAKQAEFSRRVKEADVVILSDYGKGALGRAQDLVRIAKQGGRLAVVDPKGGDFERYRGADIITPNRKELAEAARDWSDEAQMDAVAQDTRRALGLEAMLVTMSEKGMKLYQSKGLTHRPAQAKEVYDVSGAGDTVVAAIAIMRGIGARWEDALDFANAAAGIVVSRLGTSVASLDEVISSTDASGEAAIR